MVHTTVCLVCIVDPHQINLELANVSYMERKLFVRWKRLLVSIFDLVYILKVMTNYFFQNVSLVLPIRSTFFYVTVIFGAPPIKTAKLWCAIFGSPFLSEKTKYGKTQCWVRSRDPTVRTYHCTFSKFNFLIEICFPKNRLLNTCQSISIGQYSVFSLRNGSPKIAYSKIVKAYLSDSN